MSSRVVAIDPRAPSAAALDAAAQVLAQGGLVAFPTETFYGLGAAALDAAAVQRVFTLKGRPAGRPLLVLVDGLAMAERIAEIPERAQALIARHWPGALTLVFRARPVVPDVVTGGTGTIGIRWSPHPVAAGVVAAFRAPITAPSANPTGLAPPTSAAGVRAHFGDTIDLVLDGGETTGGLASTVLDVTTDPPRVVRAGAVRI
ncbi:MAG: threonylcarbamoyl-AMP synthase [Candidatus Rokubacteria bacterium]|nr:threonylcarbamoyl-AMP synthase [Candidatus Rokubacteria bacterium]